MARSFFAALLLVSVLAAQPASNGPKPMPLWEGPAPGAQGSADEDQPTITPFLVPAGQATGTAVVVCPGGGYLHLSMDKEGSQIALWLNSLGVSAFVLKYRLGPRYQHPIELGDAQRAIRTVRSRAAEYGLRAGPHRHHGILRRRTSGLHRRHPLRCRRCERRRPHRPCLQPPGFHDPVLPRDLLRPVRAPRLASNAAGRSSRSRAWSKTSPTSCR